MFQYDNPEAAVSLPTPKPPGAPGYYSDGDLSLGVARSPLTADQMNMIQLELLNVLAAGGVTPSKTTYNQVALAIQNLIGGNVRTGTVRVELDSTVPAGWVRAIDATIGDASSGASERANADTVALFTLLWNQYPDAAAPVSGGRGASAATDYAAHKKIQLGFIAGRVLGARGTGAGLSARAAGDHVGEEAHTLLAAESGVGLHHHTISDPTNGGAASNFVIVSITAAGIAQANTTSSARTGPATTDNTSADASSAHNTMQPTVFLNVFIKL